MSASPLPSAARPPTSAVEVVDRRFARTAEANQAFFAAHDELVARACHEMARRFEKGGRLLVLGAGHQASDARHVAVEFVHPVIVGKRALPAIALVAERAVSYAIHASGS